MQLENINLQDPVRIGFYDPFSIFPSIQDDFMAKFPLANLHWKYHQLKPLKSIPLLPIELHEEFPSTRIKKHEKNPEFPSNVYLRLMFVRVDDYEGYRAQVRPLIKEWLKESSRDPLVSWAIVLVMPGDRKDKKSNILKTSFLDKLRVDFGPGGKHVGKASSPEQNNITGFEEIENILRLNETYNEKIEKLEEYNVITSAIKSLLLVTFGRKFENVSRRIEILSTSSVDDFQGNLEYCCEQLKLAAIFSDMKCLAESLEIYEELSSNFRRLEQKQSSHITSADTFSHFDFKKFDPEADMKKYDPFYQFTQCLIHNHPIDRFSVKFGLFLRMSRILQTLANFAPSLSVASRYISILLHKTICILSDLELSFTHSVYFDQWSYAMAEFHLQLPLLTKLSEINSSQNEISENNVTGIMEYSAELKLLMRSTLNKIATIKGYELPTSFLFLKEVSLNDAEEEHLMFELSYEPLKLSLENQESYESQFERLTTSAISDFANCDRIKTIDILSIDLAMIHYRKREYVAAFEILQNSHNYFLRNGWNFLGGMLLDIYLDCVQNIQQVEIEHLLRSTLLLFSAMSRKNDVIHSVNDYSVIKNFKQRHQLFQTLILHSQKLDVPLSLPFDELFQITVSPYIDSDTTGGDYFIELTIVNRFGLEITVHQIEATLRNMECNEEVNLSFCNSQVVLSEKVETKAKLYTRSFCSGNLVLTQISLKLTEKLIFMNTFSSENSSGDKTVLKHTSIETEKGVLEDLNDPQQSFQMYAIPGHLRVQILPSKVIEIGTFSLEVTVLNGVKPAKDISLRLASNSMGLLVSNDSDRISFDRLLPAEERSHLFVYQSDSKIINITGTCTFEIEGKLYEYHLREIIDTNLIISVSVQDIFRNNSIYSKFQIGCVNSNCPVRIIDCNYFCSQGKYKVSCSSTQSAAYRSLVVFGEQPAYFFYKIVPNAESFDSSDHLHFWVTYSNLRNECSSIVSQALHQHLKDRSLEKYLFLFEMIVKDIEFDLLAYSIDGQVISRNFSQIINRKNPIILGCIPLRLIDTIFETFSMIFDDEGMLIGDFNLNAIAQQILKIPVSIPTLNMLHWVEFVLENKPPYIAGEPIRSKLKVRSSSKWANTTPAFLASSSPTRSDDSKVRNFELTILNEDDWLISGFKRQIFAVSNTLTTTEIDLCIIPLNVGKILYPKVIIKVIDEKDLNMDLINENALDTVLVIPELRSVNFAL